jgi:hypothetical protein
VVRALPKWGPHPSKFTPLLQLSTHRQPLRLSFSNNSSSPCSQRPASSSTPISIQWMRRRLQSNSSSNLLSPLLLLLTSNSRLAWSSRCQRSCKHKEAAAVAVSGELEALISLKNCSINPKLWLAMIILLNSMQDPLHQLLLPNLQTTWTSTTTHLKDDDETDRQND